MARMHLPRRMIVAEAKRGRLPSHGGRVEGRMLVTPSLRRAPPPGRWGFAIGGLLVILLLAGCSAGEATNGPYTTSIPEGLQTRLSAADAVAITRAYLDQQRGELAAPELHADPHIDMVWAATATTARRIDGCVPTQTSDRVVWITRGTGDYLNLHDYPWSSASRPTDDPAVIACEGPGPAGVIVIDDGSGEILGVYPLNGGQYPHPSP